MRLYQLLLVEYPTLLQVGEGSEGSCFRGSTQQATLISQKAVLAPTIPLCIALLKRDTMSRHP